MSFKLFFLFFTVVFLQESTYANFISRESWGSNPVKTPAATLSGSVEYVIIHHSETPECLIYYECSKRTRNIQHFHINERKWDDIGYNWIIGGDGHIYEGRGWQRVGAHAPNYNDKSIGVVLIGSFQNKMPNPDQLDALDFLIKKALEGNYLKSNYKVKGHRQVRETDCPGNSLFKYVKTMSHFEP